MGKHCSRSSESWFKGASTPSEMFVRVAWRSLYTSGAESSILVRLSFCALLIDLEIGVFETS